MTEQFANQAESTLSKSVSAESVSLELGTESNFPAVGDFRVVCEGEIMLATARAGKVLTVTRGVEGTVAAKHSAGRAVVHVLTAASARLLVEQSIPPSVVSSSPTGGIPAWVKETTYALNTLVTNGGNTYVCKTAHKSEATFVADEGNWQILGGGLTKAEAESLIAADVAELDTDVHLAANSNTKVASQAATRAFAQSDTGLFLPMLVGQNPSVTGSNGPAIKKIYLLRMEARKSGVLHDLSMFVAAKAGKGIVGLYDTGQANAGNYTRLSEGGEVEPTENSKWKIMHNPERTVVRGEQFMGAFIWNTGTTITLGRGNSGAGIEGSQTLPASFIPAGGAEPKLIAITAEQTEFKLPEKITEAAAVATAGNVPFQIIGRIV